MDVEEQSSSESSLQEYLGWWDAWRIAITRPNLIFYESLAHNTSITNNRAYLWLLIGGFISGLGVLAYRLIYGPAGTDNSLVFVCGPFLYSLFAVIVNVILIVITNQIAKILGGAGVYPQLLRTISAWTAPLMIITSIISLIPLGQYVNYGLTFYQVGLAILSVKAVHRIGWGSATVASVAFILPALMMVCDNTILR